MCIMGVILSGNEGSQTPREYLRLFIWIMPMGNGFFTMFRMTSLAYKNNWQFESVINPCKSVFTVTIEPIGIL